MEHYAGLDVSLELTSVCIVDERGTIVSEAKVASEPEALLADSLPTARKRTIGFVAFQHAATRCSNKLARDQILGVDQTAIDRLLLLLEQILEDERSPSAAARVHQGATLV